MEPRVFSLQVYPRLPEAIERLAELASNLWFSWHPPTRRLFGMIDAELWWRTGENPKFFLRCVDQGVLDRAAQDEVFIGSYRKVLAEFDAYQEVPLRRYKAAGLKENDLVAYFCAEYGFHESFPIYSGGLGILAGDHCKTASDLRMPFVGVGLLYRQGYFNQAIDRHGNQVPEYPLINAEDIPVKPAVDAEGRDVTVSCPFPERTVRAKVWRARVGRVRVLLLDTDIAENAETDRGITRVLYGGGSELRLNQELVLGIGGVRALRACGIRPTVWHLNEGHAAFTLLERAREITGQQVEFASALEAVSASTVFTTHTPVAAGHDSFPRDLAVEHLPACFAELGLSADELFELGTGGAQGQEFNMTQLALRGAGAVNGVSRIHRDVSSELYQARWPEVPAEENPVGYVTNGVHVPTFMRQAWADLLAQHLGPSWRQHLMERPVMEQILQIPDDRFWYTNQQVKSEMLFRLRQRLQRQHTRNQVSEAHIGRLMRYLNPDDPNVLTIGFARRFATYKRATLLFNDLDWLRDILDRDERPVVFLFAGKAHPADEPAQQLLHEIHRLSSVPELIGKIVLVEGYDIGLGRLLTSGVDVWLNTPIHPFEASGTSGMKAAINSTVNLSVLDGWWAEAYDGANGWAIPPSTDDHSDAERDRQDAQALYEILQDEVIPLYYGRDPKLGYSPGWVKICKRSMASVLPEFNSQRFLHDYACSYYGPASERGRAFEVNGYAVAHALARWKARVRERWAGVTLRLVGEPSQNVAYGSKLDLEVEAQLNGLTPADVRVECIVSRHVTSELTVPIRHFAEHGRYQDGIRPSGAETRFVVPLTAQGEAGPDEAHLYRLSVEPPWAGALRYRVRAVPQHPQLTHPYELGLMRWL
jgi:starch phosphorylase